MIIAMKEKIEVNRKMIINENNMTDNENNFTEIDKEAVFQSALKVGKIGAIILIVGCLFVFLPLFGKAISLHKDFFALVRILLIGIICCVANAFLGFFVGAGLEYGQAGFSGFFNIISKILYLPVVGWIIYLGIKLLVSLYLGWIPFGYELIRRLVIKFKIEN